jgi:hypothetical protein
MNGLLRHQGSGRLPDALSFPHAPASFRRATGAGYMQTASTPISLGGSHLVTTRHVCALFSSEEEEYRVLLPFIRDGFDAGHKALHVVNPGQRLAHLARLAGAGIDTAAAEGCGQLEVRANTDTYLRDGRFDQDRMVEVFSQVASGSCSHGFPLSRIVCRMDWAAGSRELVDNVIEFESRVNEVWNRHDDAVICTYQISQFSGDAVIDILRTHPLVIIGGLLQHNPFFIPPEQFIHEFRARRAQQTTHGAGTV